MSLGGDAAFFSPGGDTAFFSPTKARVWEGHLWALFFAEFSGSLARVTPPFIFRFHRLSCCFSLMAI